MPSQIVEQIEVNQEVVLIGVSKLNDSGLDKKQRDQPQLYPKNSLEIWKWIWYCLLYWYLSHKLIDRIIE